jgi:Dihydroxyacetone kinase family
VRDSSCDVGPIREGDFLGIARDGGIVVVDASLGGAVTALLDIIVTDGHDIVTIIKGDGATQAVMPNVEEWLGRSAVRRKCRGAPGRAAALPVLVRCGVTVSIKGQIGQCSAGRIVGLERGLSLQVDACCLFHASDLPKQN